MWAARNDENDEEIRKMPALDGTSILAIASFLGLVVAWIAAPSTTSAAAEPELQPAAV